MKLYDTFNQYISFILLFLLLNNCFGQEHHLSDLNTLLENRDDIENDLQHMYSPLSTQEVEQKPITNEIEMKTSPTYWHLPKPLAPSLGLIENQILRFINLFPELLQTTVFERINNRETLTNTIWFGFICTICFLSGMLFRSMGAKRLRQSKCEKQIRSQRQQLQEHDDQMEFEYATFKRKHQKLLNEMDEMKSVAVRYEDNLLHLQQKHTQLHKDLKAKHTECNALQKDLDYKQGAIKKHEFDIQKQLDMIAHLNNEILGYQQELEKKQRTIIELQSNDLSSKGFEKRQQAQDHTNQLDIDNNELMISIKQLKDLLRQRDETIARIPEEILNNILSTNTEDDSDNSEQQEPTQHISDIDSRIEEKTRRVKELDALLNQEKDRCRELETKLKVILELRERDAHLHIRQFEQTDVELRKARTDTERVRILQQQLELKEQQLDDVQRVLGSEQTKFSEECSKLQHETHEKWMEVKRLTRELDGARKECEGLRRQITKYANSDRSSQEKTMHKPVPHHLNNTGRLSSEPETNGSSQPPLSFQQGEKSIDPSNDSSTTSPVNLFKTKPPSFVFLRPCFRPPSLLIPANRYPMPFNASPVIKPKENFLSTDTNKT